MDKTSDNPAYADSRVAYAVNDLADALGIGRTKLYSEIASGRLQAKKLAAATPIPADAVRALTLAPASQRKGRFVAYYALSQNERTHPAPGPRAPIYVSITTPGRGPQKKGFDDNADHTRNHCRPESPASTLARPVILRLSPISPFRLLSRDRIHHGRACGPSLWGGPEMSDLFTYTAASVDAASIPIHLRAADGEAKAPPQRIPFLVHDGEGGTRRIAPIGRDAWMLGRLVAVGANGITTIECGGAPRVSGYIHKLRHVYGLQISSTEEMHDGPYAGRHVRYHFVDSLRFVADESEGA